MQRTQRVAERLPEFYRSWDPDSVIYKLVDAFARSLNEQQQDIFRIARTHWVETAHHADLDALGAIFDLERVHGESDVDYRRRVKNGVQQFRGGGTRESVISMIAAFLRVRRDQVGLEENPPMPLSVSRTARGDTEWELGSMSVDDATPKVEITIDDESEKIVNPTLSVKETGAWMRFRGTVLHGQRLTIDGGHAELDGKDVTDQLELNGTPALLRLGSTWDFHEELSSLVGSFDHAAFDGSVFQKPVPTVRVKFEWTARQPCTFDVTVPYHALEKSGTSPEEVEALLSVIRAQGIRATLRVKE
ncbi:MAG: hypothetical protein JRN09_02335 [Nitrososphaerota archaeon]|nr:hypothetical protein [Nitrososphaerota archaeon]